MFRFFIISERKEMSRAEFISNHQAAVDAICGAPTDLISIDDLNKQGWSKKLLHKMNKVLGYPRPMPNGQMGYSRARIAANKLHPIVLNRDDNILAAELQEPENERKRVERAKADEESNIEKALRHAETLRAANEQEAIRKHALKVRRNVARSLKIKVADVLESDLVAYAATNSIAGYDHALILIGKYKTLAQCIAERAYPVPFAEPAKILGVDHWSPEQLEQLHTKASAVRLGYKKSEIEKITPVTRCMIYVYPHGRVTSDLYRESDLRKLTP
jgi:hypothetical protein